MNAWIGWALAALALVAGYAGYGWPGVALAVTVTVFVLLLQFSRTLRVMRAAAQAPVGSVASAVMMHARLRKGMRLLDVVRLSGSLGSPVEEGPIERYGWRDSGGARLIVALKQGRVQTWSLERPA